MRQCKQLFGWSFAVATILAAGAAREAAGEVILTGRTSQMQISGGANEGGPMGSGGYAYYPPATGTTNHYATFADTQSDSAVSGATHSYSANSSADQLSSVDTRLYDVFYVASGYGYTHAAAINTPAPPQGGGGSAWGDSFFDIFFDVTVDSVPYELRGSVNAVFYGSGGSPSTSAHVVLSKIGVGDIYSGYSWLAPLTFDNTGVLAPGSYELYMQAHADAPGGFTGTSSAEFNITLTVPEPSTFVLLAAGAIGLVAFGWRRRRQAASA